VNPEASSKLQPIVVGSKSFSNSDQVVPFLGNYGKNSKLIFFSDLDRLEFVRLGQRILPMPFKRSSLGGLLASFIYLKQPNMTSAGAEKCLNIDLEASNPKKVKHQPVLVILGLWQKPVFFGARPFRLFFFLPESLMRHSSFVVLHIRIRCPLALLPGHSKLELLNRGFLGPKLKKRQPSYLSSI
jgi:hypothetical protein